MRARNFLQFLAVLLFSIASLGALSAPASAAVLSDYDGTYVGTWFNNTFSSTGAATITFASVGSNVTWTTDMDGFVFGLLDPGVVVLNGTVVAGEIVVNQTVATYGTVVGTINLNSGAVNAIVNMVPGRPEFADITVAGTAVPGVSFDVTYSIDVLGGPFTGTLNLVVGGAAVPSLSHWGRLWLVLSLVAGATLFGRRAARSRA